MGKEKNEFGEVIAVGTGRFTISGKSYPMQVKSRRFVVLPTQGFYKITI